MIAYLLGIVSGIVFASLYRWVIKPVVETVRPKLVDYESVIRIRRSGAFRTVAKGTSHYQAALKGESGRIKVVLEYEDTNKFDDQAVRILLNGRVAGYLSREDARAFRRDRIKAQYSCWAKVVGGYDGKFYGLRLDI